VRKIAVIGVGNIGGRYVESLLNSDSEYDLYVVDTSVQALKALEDKIGGAKKKVTYLSDVEMLPNRLDLAAITTTSGVRRVVVEKLFKHVELNYLILEKPLFCDLADYEIAGELLKEKRVKAWTNCTRRETDSYQSFKSKLKDENFEFILSGSNWGMGCNAIHYLDLICFLAGTDNLEVNADGLYKTVLDGKRKPYKEILGTITGNAGKCVHFSLTDYGKDGIPMSILVKTPSTTYLINETRQLLNVWEMDGSCINADFKLPYTSQAMGRIIGKIIDTGNCQLPNYSESVTIHRALQIPLTEFFEKMGGEKGICPIS